MSLNTKNYLKKIILLFLIDIFKPYSSTIDHEIPNFLLPIPENHQANRDPIFWYKAVVGSLIYAMSINHLDL